MNTKKIEELENTIKQAQKQIEELKKEDEMPKFEYPRIGKKVWIINKYGDIDWVVWSDTEIGKNMAHLGMLFFTKEEAEFEVERRKVITELKLFAEPKDREWDGNNEHYTLCANVNDKTLSISSAHNWIYPFSVFFESEEIAQKAIDYVGEDRIMRFYLEVEDGYGE